LKDDGNVILTRLISTLPEDVPIAMSAVKIGLLKIDPAFSEKKYGFSAFKPFIESFIGGLVSKIEDDPDSGLPVVNFNHNIDLGSIPEEITLDSKMTQAKSFLTKNLKYLDSMEDGMTISNLLISLSADNTYFNMKELADYLYQNTNKISKNKIKKFINVLYMQRLFEFHEDDIGLPLDISRFKLKGTYKAAGSVIEEYYARIVHILDNKFPGLSEDDYAELL